jgi:hypothetical protein
MLVQLICYFFVFAARLNFFLNQSKSKIKSVDDAIKVNIKTLKLNRYLRLKLNIRSTQEKIGHQMQQFQRLLNQKLKNKVSDQNQLKMLP